MKSFKYALLLMLFVAFTLPVYASGFKIEGEDFEHFKLTFDSTGVDRSSAEGVAKSLLDVKYKLYNNPEFMLLMEKLEINIALHNFGKFLSEKGVATYLGRQKSKLEESEKMKSSFRHEYKIELGKGETGQDGTITFSFKVEISSSRPCYRCQEKENKDCPSCKGTRIMARKNIDTGNLVTFQKDGLWLVKDMYQKCGSCGGNGICQNCSKPGVKCHLCLGSGKCHYCEGTGKRTDSFLRGPSKVEGLLNLNTAAPNFSTPQGATEAFFQAVNNKQIQQGIMSNQMNKAFESFLTFFLGDAKGIQRKSAPLEVKSYKILKVEVTGEKAWVVFEKILPPEPENKHNTSHLIQPSLPEYARRTAVDLVKDKDGNWKIEQFYGFCYNCRTLGQQGQYQCAKCKNMSYYDNFCKECKEKMPALPGTTKPCPTCNGKGFQATNYLPTY